MSGSRVSLSEVISIVLEKLPTNGVVTPSDLKKAGIQASWQTILKAAQLIEEIQKKLEERGIVIDIWREGREWKIGTRKRLHGMSLSERLRYVRQNFFPEPDERDILLTEMLRVGATDPKAGIRLRKNKLVEEMLKDGWIAENQGNFYLTDLGVKISKTILRMYPELKTE